MRSQECSKGKRKRVALSTLPIFYIVADKSDLVHCHLGQNSHLGVPPDTGGQSSKSGQAPTNALVDFSINERLPLLMVEPTTGGLTQQRMFKENYGSCCE